MGAAFGLPLQDLADPARWSLRIVLPGALPPAWAHCGMTAEMLGGLYSKVAVRGGADANEARHGISYLCNELLENAMKFRHSTHDSIELAVACDDGLFEFQVRNYAEPATAAGFERLLGEITTRDPGELLLERIEANALNEDAGASGLGILTMMNDYGVEFGWRLDVTAKDGAPVSVQTYARLRLHTSNGN